MSAITSFATAFMRRLFLLLLLCFFLFNCRQMPAPAEVAEPETETTIYDTPLDKYVHTPDPAFQYEVVDTLAGEGFSTYVVRMVSQRWLTEAEVKAPVWWHWLTIVVPNEVKHDKGMLFIGGGSRKANSQKNLMK